MKKLLLIFISIMLIMSFGGCQTQSNESKDGAQITVAVGIVPQEAFVEAVAGELVSVVTMIPPGYSPANFSPTAAQMQELSDAAVYFTLQMPAEQANILPKVKDFSRDIEIVDLREAAAAQYPLLSAEGHDHDEEHEDDHSEEYEDEHDHGSVDPHLWLSPKRAVVMVQTIADELSKIDSSHTQTYQKNAADYIAKIEALDEQIKQKLSSLQQKDFLIYHGSYGYFADDYGLKMIAIEIAGKQATSAELQDVISFALENDIKTVFYQDEFDDNQAQTVAQEIGGTVAKVSPLSKDYIKGLSDFTDSLIAQDG